MGLIIDGKMISLKKQNAADVVGMLELDLSQKKKKKKIMFASFTKIRVVTTVSSCYMTLQVAIYFCEDCLESTSLYNQG